MNIERAMEIVRAKGRRVPLAVVGDHIPAGVTIWGAGPNDILQQAVYFAYSGGLIKIGWSLTPRSRQAELSAASALPVTMILLVPGSEADERKFHKRFAASRVHHEWFRIDKKMRDFLKARLCPIGRASLGLAEDQFRTHCKEQLP